MINQKTRRVTQIFLSYFPYWQEIRLLPQEKQTLILSYGLNNNKPLTPLEISQISGFEVEDVHMYKTNGLSKLIHYNKECPPVIKEFTNKINVAKKLDYLDDYPYWNNCNLTEKEKQVFILYMGANNTKPHSYQEIADILGITRQASANLGQKAFKKIESYVDKEGLVEALINDRQKLQLTQGDFAQKLGFHPMQYYKLETGQRKNISPSIKERLLAFDAKYARFFS